jgi:hypothetical protein
MVNDNSGQEEINILPKVLEKIAINKRKNKNTRSSIPKMMLKLY